MWVWAQETHRATQKTHQTVVFTAVRKHTFRPDIVIPAQAESHLSHP
jgi:hypothetical protein